MCGIAGIYSSRQAVDQTMIPAMLGKLQHRGPDALGVFDEDSVTLGHRRLKIIDLSDAANQPMESNDKRFVIVFNGEIYNFQKLKVELEESGDILQTRSDTEVLLAAYARWGEKCLSKLQGMFAFAVWDRLSKRLFLARDRVGEKPLYYSWKNGVFTFASEIPALLVCPWIARAPNLEAFHLFYVFSDIAAPNTVWRDIRCLEPGHCITICDGEFIDRQWWQLSYNEKIDLNFPDACQQLRDIMGGVIRDMSVCDVPYGVLLSGGVDSSVVAYELNRITTRSQALTVGMRQGNKDSPDLERSRIVSKKLGLNHIQEYFQAVSLESLPSILQTYGQPYSNGTALIIDPLLQRAKKHAVMLLTGNGADEVFGGYAYLGRYRKFQWLRSVFDKILAKFEVERQSGQSFIKELRKYTRGALESCCEHYRQKHIQMLALIEGGALAEHCRDMDVSTPLVECWQKAGIRHPLDGVLHLHLMLLTNSCHTTIPDRSGMRYNLELRAPFLDVRVLEFAARLPVNYKIMHPRSPVTYKSILKKAYEHALPKEILYAPKVGFGSGVSFGDLYRNEWRQQYRDWCLNGRAIDSGLVDKRALSARFSEHCSGKRNWDEILTNTLCLELWLRGTS